MIRRVLSSDPSVKIWRQVVTANGAPVGTVPESDRPSVVWGRPFFRQNCARSILPAEIDQCFWVQPTSLSQVTHSIDNIWQSVMPSLQLWVIYCERNLISLLLLCAAELLKAVRLRCMQMCASGSHCWNWRLWKKLALATNYILSSSLKQYM